MTAVLAVAPNTLAYDAQVAADPPRQHVADSVVVERDSLTMFRRELEIGVERFELRRSGDGLSLHAVIAASVRATLMPVDATLHMDTMYGLRQLRFRGALNAWTLNVDRSVDVANGAAHVRDGALERTVRVPLLWYTLPAHVPASAHAMLVRYWRSHGRPDSLATVDERTIGVRDHGVDTVVTRGRRILLRRYSISGVTWAREVLWLDDSARVYALATNTNGIAYQFVRRGHEDALPRLMEHAPSSS